MHFSSGAHRINQRFERRTFHLGHLIPKTFSFGMICINQNFSSGAHRINQRFLTQDFSFLILDTKSLFIWDNQTFHSSTMQAYLEVSQQNDCVFSRCVHLLLEQDANSGPNSQRHLKLVQRALLVPLESQTPDLKQNFKVE